MIERRKQIRSGYRALFAGVDGVQIFGGADDAEDNHWLTAILVDSAITGWTTAELAAALTEQNIESRPLWKPMHLQPVFANARARVNGVSEDLFHTGLSLPSGSAMDGSKEARVHAAVRAFLDGRR